MEEIKGLSERRKKVCIKDVELNLKILNESFKKDYKDDEIENAIRHLIDTGKNIIVDLRYITMQMECNGLYKKWQIAGLEVEILKFIRNMNGNNMIDEDTSEDEDAFITMLRGVYTMCKRYTDIVLAVNGSIKDNNPTKDSKRGRPKSNIANRMIDDEAGLKLDKLRRMIKGKKGKDVALIILACIKKGWMSRPTFSELTDEFGDIGTQQGFSNYLHKTRFSGDEIEGVISNLNI